MSLKPLTFYQQGAVAGMQQDQYSQAPWFVDSKNLDIFSSSQSVKATAWSEPKLVDSNIVDVDHRGRFELHKNGKVRDREASAYITNNDNFSESLDSIQYLWESETLQFWTPKNLVVKYGDVDWETIVVITDRMAISYYRKWLNIEKLKINNSDWYSVKTDYQGRNVYQIKPLKNWVFNVIIENVDHMFGKFRFVIRRKDNSSGNIRLKEASWRAFNATYSKREKSFSTNWFSKKVYAWIGDLSHNQDEITLECYGSDGESWGMLVLSLETSGWYNGMLQLDLVEVTEDKQLFLPEERWLTKQEDFFYSFSTNTFRRFFFSEERNKYRSQKCYQFIFDTYKDYGKEVSIISMMLINEQNYVFLNKGGSFYFYIIEWDWEISTYRAYEWYTLLSATRVGEIIYMIVRARGMVGLYAYYNWTLKKISSPEILDGNEDSINPKKPLHFNGLLCTWREHLILGTDDNQIVAYRENQGRNVFTNILKKKGIKKILNIKAGKDRLEISYLWTDDNTYSLYSQDDRILKNYQSDFSITFPKQIGSHLLEKEPKELEISYMLPNKNCSLEIWLNVNDYHFRTYELEGEAQITNGSYKIDGTDGEYQLKFIEKRENKLTFVLEGELPHQTEKKALKLIKLSWDWPEEIVAKSFDHFKYVGTIREEKFTHGKQRLVALTAEHNLPRARVLQIRVDWKTDWKSSPEIYSVHFTSEQVER